MDENTPQPFLAPSPLDRWPRLKNRLLSRMQGRLLDTFGWLSRRSDLDRVVASLSRRWVGPFLYAIKLEVNAACALHCRMCYLEPSGLTLPLELLDGLFADLRGRGVRIEILGGEPLLRDDVVEIVARAKTRARSPFVSLYTNALPARPRLCVKLRRAGLDAVLVTLISHRAEVHDAFCGRPGAWAETVRGIGHLRDAGLTVYTFTAVHRENHLDCAAIHDYVSRSLKVRPTFFPYVAQRPADPLVIDRPDWRRIKRWALVEKNPEHHELVRRFFLLTGNACSGGQFVLTVKADGTVQPCPFVADVPLGDLRRDGIWTIYRRRFAAPRFAEFKRLPAECEPCSYRSVCGGGCRAASGKLFGRYDRKDHQCLGPYSEPLDKQEVVDRVPTFF